MKLSTSITIVSVILLLSACNSTVQELSNQAKSAVASTYNATVNLLTDETVSPDAIRDTFTIHPGLALQDPLLGGYGTSVILMFTAQEIWLDAIGSADLAAKLRDERIALENGAVIDSDAIERHTRLSTETQKIVNLTLDEQTAISNEGRIKFASGWVPYIAGLKQTDAVVDISELYLKSIKKDYENINMIAENTRKVLILTTLSSQLPSYANVQYSTLDLIIKYAQNQGLDVPEEANDLMGDISLD